MKKNKSLIMVLLLAVTFTGCGTNETATSTPTPSIEATEKAVTKAPEETEVPEETELPDEAEAPEETEAPDETNDSKATKVPEGTVSEDEKRKMDAMEPIYDSLIRAMEESKNGYKPKDQTFFWDTLYLVAVNYGLQHPLVEQDEFETKVPRKVMQEYASACFLDYDDLLEFPEESSIQYSEDFDAYILPLSDRGDTYTEIDNIIKNEEGFVVTVHYKDKKNVIATYEVSMVDNPYASGISNPNFYYTVKDIVGK